MEPFFKKTSRHYSTKSNRQSAMLPAPILCDELTESGASRGDSHDTSSYLPSPNTQLGLAEGFRPITQQLAAHASSFFESRRGSLQDEAAMTRQLLQSSTSSTSALQQVLSGDMNMSPYTKVAMDEGFAPLTNIGASRGRSDGTLSTASRSSPPPRHGMMSPADSMERTLPPSVTRPPRAPTRPSSTTSSCSSVMSPAYGEVGAGEGFIPVGSQAAMMTSRSDESVGKPQRGSLNNSLS